MRIDDLIEAAIREDITDPAGQIPAGDHTSLATIPEGDKGKARLLVKEDGILAGVELAQKIFKRLDPSVQFDLRIPDGSAVSVGDVAFYVSGKTRSLLQSERIVLNFMQRMSGIATQVNKYVKAIAGTGAKVLDTRKTTPALRVVEKWAVKIGGGENHRFGLYDMIMVKDNHIDFCGGVVEAIEAVDSYQKANGLSLKVELECRNLQDVQQVLDTGKVDRIMLDNFDPETTRKAVELIGGRLETESSGGITLDTIRSYAESGVDYISVGALTHSVPSLDLSLKAVED